MPDAQKWTFSRLQAAEPTGGIASSGAVSSVPAWAVSLGVFVTVGVVAGTSVGVAIATGIIGSSAASESPAALLVPGGPPPPPIPPVQPPYNADNAEDYCNNDCMGCAQNGGCTYSYGADNDTDTQHDSRYYQSNGVCDDGGPGSEQSICNYGSDCADCGVRAMPPPPPDYPSMPPGLR